MGYDVIMMSRRLHKMTVFMHFEYQSRKCHIEFNIYVLDI